jgi:D-arabinose 1-dehydrogenase-like Zn-dependent alcohol dehydrogenase
MAKMKVAQVSKPGDLEIVEREIPQPPAGHVRIRVQACGICYSDHLTKDNSWPGLQYPRVLGHEVAGVIDEVGAGKACRVHSGYARRKAATSSLRAYTSS